MTDTMRTIVCTKNLLFTTDATPEEKLRSIKDTVIETYNEELGSDEHYCLDLALIEPYDHDAHALAEFAQSWNNTLQKAVSEAYLAWQAHGCKSDTMEIRNLAKAAAAFAGNIEAYANTALFNMPTQQDIEDTDFQFSNIIADYVLSDIQTNPQDYLVVDLFIK